MNIMFSFFKNLFSDNSKETLSKWWYYPTAHPNSDYHERTGEWYVPDYTDALCRCANTSTDYNYREYYKNVVDYGTCEPKDIISFQYTLMKDGRYKLYKVYDYYWEQRTVEVMSLSTYVPEKIWPWIPNFTLPDIEMYIECFRRDKTLRASRELRLLDEYNKKNDERLLANTPA